MTTSGASAFGANKVNVRFDGMLLWDAEPWEMGFEPRVSELALLTGRTIIQAATTYGLGISFRCNPTSYTEITNLRGKFGKEGILVVDGTTLSKCYISGLTVSLFSTSSYEYEVEFRQMTGATT
jgi:hypothetical protein